MDDKRQIGSVYCIAGIDQFGKITHNFQPLKDIVISKEKKLGSVLLELSNEINDLKNKHNELVKKVNDRLETIVKTVNANQESCSEAIKVLSEEIAKERFL